MAALKPFRALRYDARRAGPLDALVAPPYDVVTPELRERLLRRSPYNAVRLVRPDEPDGAAATLSEWRDAGVLVREEGPAVWLLEEDFVGPDGVGRTRRGLVARVRLEPYASGRVLPHERTFEPAKEARLRLLRATRTKLSPILLLHRGDPPPAAPARRADLEASLDGVRSRLWAVTRPREVDALLGRVAFPLLIADGHHRYETALRFHEEDGGEETAHVLAALVSRADPGVVICATHRLVEGSVPELDGRLRLTELAGGADDALSALARVPRGRPAFALLRPGGAVLAEADVRALDTALVDRLPLCGVRFTPSAQEAAHAVESGEAAAAFLVRPPTLADLEAVARAGERMPEKSTYFFPKLTSGLVFSPFDE